MEWKVHYLASEYVRQGHEVEVFAGRPSVTLAPIRIPVEPTYRVERCGFPVRGFEYLGVTKALFVANVLRRHRVRPFDVLHSHHLGPPTGYAVAVKRLTGLPVVATPCGGDVQCVPEIGYGDRCRPRFDRLVRRNVTRVDVIAAISSSIREELAGLGTAARIVDIPNGLPWAMFQGPPSRLLHAKLGLPDDAVIILSVGRNEPVKGFSYALQAFARAAAQFPKAVYVFLGRGMEPLRQQAREAGLASRVRFCEQVPMAQLPEVFHAAAIYLSSSIVEGFSQVNVQAMAAGLPCVLSDAPGNRDAAMQGGALLARNRDAASMGDCLARLLGDRCLREEMGRRAHEASRRYCWSRIAREYLDIFESLSRKPRSA